MTKRGEGKKEHGEAEREQALKMTEELAVDFRKGGTELQEFNQNVQGLETLADKLTETQKKILNVILTDFGDEPEVEQERVVFQRLRAACARAGMLDNRSDQIAFFSTIADPSFMHVVRAVGAGIIGIYIVPVVAKVIQQALEGDKTSQRWVMEISGLKQDKYDFYLNRWNLTHTEVNIDELNFDGKTDEELKGFLAKVQYDAEAESVGN